MEKKHSLLQMRKNQIEMYRDKAKQRIKADDFSYFSTSFIFSDFVTKNNIKIYFI
jgi:hypothetical protein